MFVNFLPYSINIILVSYNMCTTLIDKYSISALLLIDFVKVYV